MGHVSSRIRRDQVPGTRFKKRTRATATLLGATLSRREREGKSLPASQPVDPAVSPRESERHRRPARGAPDGASRDRSANGRLAQIIRYLRPPTITKIGPSGSFQNCRWTRETRRRFFVHAHTALSSPCRTRGSGVEPGARPYARDRTHAYGHAASVAPLGG
jgi:hypothetical protein